MDFNGKVVLVTGGARGIGKGIAKKFLELGGTVVLIDINEEELKSSSQELGAIGKTGYYTCNVADMEAVGEMVKSIQKDYGSIDVLINNAGITRDTLLIRMKESDWHSVMQVNLKGTFICTQKCLKVMFKQRSGKIVNISSVIGIMGNVGQANYAASKAGMIGFTKSVAKEAGARNINVNAIAPGFIETEMTQNLKDEVKEDYMSRIPMRKFGSTEDVANLVAFLASEESKYITGQVIAIDGGML